MFVFAYVQLTFKVPSIWLTRLQQNCGDGYSVYTLNSLSLLESGAIVAAYTGYTGLTWMSQSGRINYATGWKRYLTLAILALPAAFPYLLFGKQMTNPYVTFIVIAFLPAAYLGMILFYLVDKLGSSSMFLQPNA